MSEQLKHQIKHVEDRIEAKDPLAFEDAVKLTEQYPQEAQVWNTLAYANSWKKDYPAAVAAMTQSINLRPGRPALHFTRGGYSLMAGDYESAIADFTEGLALGNHLEREPYREVLYFLRAEAYYQLGRKAEARADLEHVEDDCTFWTVQVRSKAELVALCAE
jgi:tetratricopeptide (TPR) repeat protein